MTDEQYEEITKRLDNIQIDTNAACAWSFCAMFFSLVGIFVGFFIVKFTQ